VLVSSQTVQFLSFAPVAAMTGLLQVRPSSVERLTSTSTVEPLMPRDEIIQTLCLASNATDASLACPKVPPPLVVMPGR
jgi:hypothetical protein